MTERSSLLIDALAARNGIVCVTGAGGKKSILYQLVRECPQRVGLTATVHTTEFPADLPMTTIVDDDAMLPERVLASREPGCIAYACPSGKAGRHAGATATTIRSIHDGGGFAATFVKADGARMRWIKAPGEDEPMIVPESDTVIPVVSARAIGECLSERIAHRVERVEAVTGVARGAPLTPAAVARLMASEAGALQRAGRARVVPVINMVDDERREQLARAAANEALTMTTRFDRVVLCCLRRPSEPVVAVVTR